APDRHHREGHAAEALGRLHLQRRQVPSARQSQSRAGRGGGVRAVPRAPDRDRAARGARDAREVRGARAPRNEDADHAPARHVAGVSRHPGDAHVPPGVSPAQSGRQEARLAGHQAGDGAARDASVKRGRLRRAGRAVAIAVWLALAGAATALVPAAAARSPAPAEPAGSPGAAKPGSPTPSPAPARGAAAGTAPRVHLVRIDGAITPAVVDFLRDSLAHAERERAAALVVEIDTPGGLLTSTRTIVQDLLGARVPVISYVAPSGAGAASAGVFIVMAANVAAMAPGTNIGASTPVEGSGGDIPGAMGRKVKSFTASFAKAIAERRGRNVEWAVRAVRRAVSVTDREALEVGVIDLVAADVPDLLAQANGREVEVAGEKRTLDVAGATVVKGDMSVRQRVFAFLADPNVAYLFMLAGLLGLYLELSHPGVLLPGIVGGICLLIALASFQILPINIAGLALLVLGVAMLVAELFLPSFGIVGVGGLVAFVLGSLFLFDAGETGIAIDR